MILFIEYLKFLFSEIKNSIMKRKIAILIFAALFGSNSLLKGQAKFDVESVKKDLSFLYQTLDKSHYDLYANTPKTVFNREFNRIKSTVNDSLSLIQIDRLFHPFVALTNEGHCSLELPISSYVLHLQKGGTLFPLDIYFNDHKALVLDNFSSDSAIKVGDEIIAINGNPIDTILKACYKYVSGENIYTKEISIESISFPRLYWIINDEETKFEVSIKRNDLILKGIQITSIPAGAFEAKKAKQNTRSNQTRVFQYINNIAYLRPGQFYNSEQQNSIQINTSVLDNRNFVRFIDSCFTIINDKKTSELIIDLRGNPGGAATFSNPLIAFFASEPFIGASEFKIRTSEISKKFWENVSDTSRLTMDIKKQILSREDGERFEIDGAQYKYHPRNDSLKFDGNVYVLINNLTFSQAIEVAGMIKKYRFGILIGEPTTPLMSANARQFKLPNTQLTVTFPEAYYGDTSMINGVMPDYYIQDDILTDKDEILDYTIKMINEEIEIK